MANCCVHALQLQLNNAVRAALGDGGLDKVNAMQLLHLVYNLQEAVGSKEWRHILVKSSNCVANFDPSLPIEEPTHAMSVAQQNKLVFEQAFAVVYKYHSKFTIQEDSDENSFKGTILQKPPAPILTRWWTVGAGTSCTFSYYLQLFHAAQTAINVFDSGSSPHIIASSLFGLMKDPENFVDLTLIQCFTRDMSVSPHLDWLQSSDDLSNKLGFQSHNIATRFFLIERDLISLPASDCFKVYSKAVCNAAGNQDGIRGLEGILDERKRHLKKQTVFITESMASLQKHFRRWLQPDLLAASLLSKAPIALMFASAMLGRMHQRLTTSLIKKT